MDELITSLFELLIVEDNEGDILLIEEALNEYRMREFIHLVAIRNSEEALKYLMAKDEYRNRPEPNLVLLDLNMPRLSGFQILESVKNEAELASIPIIIFSSSSSPSDITQSYKLRANAYVMKPVNLDMFFGLMDSIFQFWIKHVKYIAK